MASFTINFHLSHPQPKINDTGFCALAGLLLKPNSPVKQLVNAKVNSGKGWFPYDRGSQIAIRSAIVCDPAIVIADDRRRSHVLSPAIVCDQLRSAICDPRSYGNQPLDRTWLYLLRSSAITIAGSQK